VPLSVSFFASNLCIVSGTFSAASGGAFAGRCRNCAILLRLHCIIVKSYVYSSFFDRYLFRLRQLLSFLSPPRAPTFPLFLTLNEKLPCTIIWRQRHRQKQPECKLCVMLINPCIIHHCFPTTLHSAPRPIDPIFALSVSIRVVAKTHHLPLRIRLSICSHEVSMQWIALHCVPAPSSESSSSFEATKNRPKWPNNPHS